MCWHLQLILPAQIPEIDGWLNVLRMCRLITLKQPTKEALKAIEVLNLDEKESCRKRGKEEVVNACFVPAAFPPLLYL